MPNIKNVCRCDRMSPRPIAECSFVFDFENDNALTSLEWQAPNDTSFPAFHLYPNECMVSDFLSQGQGQCYSRKRPKEAMNAHKTKRYTSLLRNDNISLHKAWSKECKHEKRQDSHPKCLKQWMRTAWVSSVLFIWEKIRCCKKHPANEKVRSMILLGLMVVGVWTCTKTLETKKAQTSLIRVFETRSHECPGFSSSHSLRVGDKTFTYLPGTSSSSKRVVHHASRIHWQPGDSNAAWQVCLTWAEASSTISSSICNVAALLDGLEGWSPTRLLP